MKNIIKQLIKKITCLLYGQKISELKVSDVKMVSFDIFDTLVLRSVGKPQNVFLEVEKEYDSIHSVKSKFYARRLAAERVARKKACEKEITIETIYSELKGYSETQKNELKELEIAVECETCEPNSEVISVFKKLVGENVDVVITSDMYLPEEIILRILRKCGIEGERKIYLSSKIGERKSTGSLFDFVIRDSNIYSNEIMHIGDNAWGDFWVPLHKGMRTFLYLKGGG